MVPDTVPQCQVQLNLLITYGMMHPWVLKGKVVLCTSLELTAQILIQKEGLT
ncbi:hypothetical protein ACWI_11470 [Acetobacterium wieringae]|jgi:hypothetical protein|uniref:Uncharacterized protein n=1 Tax=Acetobacterium wieringae TaxID=52694 RepID=A0A1F2PJ95_9FIRM|nr:hypothetical protein ACWI_11470 [Acetobacterium wieringae]